MNIPHSAGGETAIGKTVARHALFWLVAGCASGLALATLLSFPRLGALLGPFTYGRIMALHLDLTLYGWLAIPLVGLLYLAFGVERRASWGRRALLLWSAALVAGALSWLSGETTGKLFLDWSGGARWVFLAALAALLVVLGASAASAAGAGGAAGDARALPRWGSLVTLVLLAAVPPALYAATLDAGYPPVNPASGGPTGVSLLGSTLALVAILLALPRFARLGPAELRADAHAPAGWAFALLFGAHFALFLAWSGTERSNDEPLELLALASVLLWVPLLPRHLRRYTWPAGSRPWARAALAWGALLAVAGVVQFLPAPLAAGKFTHLLVAHAHLAMAGFASAVSFLLLELGYRNGAPLAARPVIGLWQAGTVAHVAALAGVGALEAQDPAALLRGSATLSAFLVLRWLAGAAMLAASGVALRRSWEAA